MADLDRVSIRRREMLALSVGTLIPWGTIAQAQQAGQSWPARQVEIVVPYPAGGTIDVPVRIIAERMARLSGFPMVVINSPGAGGVLAARNLLRSPADGYKIVATGAALPVSAILRQPPPYDPKADFTHVARVTTAPHAIVVAVDSPLKTIHDLVSAAKSAPLMYGSPGVGTATHIFMESLAARAGTRFEHVAYKGAGPAMTDLTGGHIAAAAVGVSFAKAFVAAGKHRLLAVTSPSRLKEYPSTPTVSESYSELHDETWIAFTVQSGVPREIVLQISSVVKAALADPEVQSSLRNVGQEPAYLPVDEVSAMVDERAIQYRQTIARANIKL